MRAAKAPKRPPTSRARAAGDIDEPAPISTQQAAEAISPYQIEIVHCVDITDSMRPRLPTLLRAMETLLRSIEELGRATGQGIATLRMRLVLFGNLWAATQRQGLIETRFSETPQERGGIERLLRKVACVDKGPPNSGLEALVAAIRSPWSPATDRHRRIVCLWANGPAHGLERALAEPPSLFHPTFARPRDFSELSRIWEETMVPEGGRVVLMAPDCYPWTTIAAKWPSSIQYVSQAGSDLTAAESEEIARALLFGAAP